jgi:hypothetical protein
VGGKYQVYRNLKGWYLICFVLYCDVIVIFLHLLDGVETTVVRCYTGNFYKLNIYWF